MDVIIYYNELDNILLKNPNDLIPHFLINLDNNTGLYYLINYWNKYSDNIHLIINTKYNNIVNYYLKKVIPDISENVNIINYDKNDGSAYIINYLLVNNIIKIKNKNLLITNPYIIPEKNINFKELEKKNKSKLTKNKKESINNIIIFLNENKLIDKDENENKETNNNDNINNQNLGIYYFENFKIFNLEQYGKNLYNEDIYVFFKDITTKINTFYLDNIINYSNEDKLKNIFLKNKTIFNTKYFNNIKIIDEERLFKSSNDNIGKELINIETNWYKYLLNEYKDESIDKSKIKINNIKNLFPKIYETYDYGFLMEYKKKYIPLSIYIKNNDINNLSTILSNIYDKINIIHNIEIIKEDKKIFLNNLKIEIYDKIINGKELIESCFNKIEYVNDIKIDSLENILLKCKNIITQYYNSLNSYEYSIILGDCNFSNILINLDDINDIVFISPCGFFGNTRIFGPKEYDYAKLLSSIYGFDDFNDNNLFINNYTFINDKSINIDFNKNIDKNILKKNFNKVHKAYMIIILLNLEYNKNNIWKSFILFHYGLYLGSTIL